jgi:hypothetical protein
VKTLFVAYGVTDLNPSPGFSTKGDAASRRQLDKLPALTQRSTCMLGRMLSSGVDG